MADPFQPTGDTCSVDGHRPKPGDKLWEELDWSGAIWRGQSTIGLFLCGQDAPADWHWDVPHRDPAWGTRHRVRKERPRRKPLFEGLPAPVLPEVPHG